MKMLIQVLLNRQSIVIERRERERVRKGGGRGTGGRERDMFMLFNFFIHVKLDFFNFLIIKEYFLNKRK